MGTHTDAFEQVGTSAHKTMDRFVPDDKFNNPDGPEEWMNDWTMFYWGWWIAWSPFVGAVKKKSLKLSSIWPLPCFFCWPLGSEIGT